MKSVSLSIKGGKGNYLKLPTNDNLSIVNPALALLVSFSTRLDLLRVAA